MAQPSTFGRYLRQKRGEARLSLRAVADRLGVSHVFLSEVERGVRTMINRDRWEALIRAIPGVTMEELGRHADRSKPIQLDLTDAPPLYQDLALCLARRMQKRDIPNDELQRLIRCLQGGGDE
jgi:transcriptional regulator with XRE-family HTH domain